MPVANLCPLALLSAQNALEVKLLRSEVKLAHFAEGKASLSAGYLHL